MKERVAWLDTAKGIGIICVILGHVYPGDSSRNVFLFSFHVPLFFFLAGYLCEPDRFAGYGDFLLRKLWTRIIPYVAFFAVSYILFVVSASRNTGPGLLAVLSLDGYRPMVIDPMIALFVANGAWLERIGNVALWFLPCLCMTESMFFILHRIAKGSMVAIGIGSVLFALAGFAESVLVKGQAPWALDAGLTAVVFYAAGYLVHAYPARNAAGVPGSRAGKAFIATGAFAATVVFALLNGRVDMNTTLYNNYLLFLLAAFSGIGMITALSQLVPAGAALTWLGRNSLVLFGLHLPLILYAKEFLNFVAELFTDKDIIIQNDIYVFLVGLVTTVLAAVCALAMTKWFPFLVGRGRKNALLTVTG